MSEISQRLKVLDPVIGDLISISGTIGLSYGVLHQGTILHAASFGHRNLEDKLDVDEETVFPLGSLSKALVAATVASLVEDGKMDWDTPVKDLLPGFSTPSQEVTTSATLVDFLSMRPGLQATTVWYGSQNNVLFPRTDSLKLINNLEVVSPLRSKWRYNNWGYELAGLVIDHVSKEGWASVLKKKILHPLGMSRSGAETSTGNDNTASAYVALIDAPPSRVGDVTLSDQTLMGIAGGVRSCVRDLLVFYRTFLKSLNNQVHTSQNSTTGSPLKHVRQLMSPHAIARRSIREVPLRAWLDTDKSTRSYGCHRTKSGPCG
jgi:CubicO group peptidase (beta-lactamase class C family)